MSGWTQHLARERGLVVGSMLLLFGLTAGTNALYVYFSLDRLWMWPVLVLLGAAVVVLRGRVGAWRAQTRGRR